MTKNSHEDSELKLLRSTLLCSIRQKRQTPTGDECDTDVADLSALRDAALKSINKQSSVKTVDARESTGITFHVVKNVPKNSPDNNQWIPKYRLRPQQRSNLIVIQTIPLDGSSLNASTSHDSLLLPQDRYLRGKNNVSMAVEHHKQYNKWNRHEREKSQSSGTDDDGSSKANDDVNSLNSDDEALTVDSIHSDSCTLLEIDGCAFKASCSTKDNQPTAPLMTNQVDKSPQNSSMQNKVFFVVNKESKDLGGNSREAFQAGSINNLVPTDFDQTSSKISERSEEMNYIERELLHLQPLIDVELLDFDEESCVFHENEPCSSNSIVHSNDDNLNERDLKESLLPNCTKNIDRHRKKIIPNTLPPGSWEQKTEHAKKRQKYVTSRSSKDISSHPSVLRRNQKPKHCSRSRSRSNPRHRRRHRRMSSS